MKAFLAVLQLLSIGVFAQTTWESDKNHSNVMFTVTHLMISEVTGKFDDFSVRWITNKADFSDATVEVTIKTASVNTHNDRRDNDLRSDNFFLAETYPEMTFKSKSFRKIDDKHYKITGDLTIRGTTKTIELDAEYKGEIQAFGTRSAWKVTGSLNRFDYGLKWNATIETGGLVVGETVGITVTTEMVKVDPNMKKN